MPSNLLLGGAILGLAVLYTIVIWVGLIALDRPMDKTKRKTTAEDGTATKHVIANDGYYFGVSMVAMKFFLDNYKSNNLFSNYTTQQCLACPILCRFIYM